MALRGEYAGRTEIDPDERDIAAYETILSSDLNGDDGPDFENNDENSYRVVIAGSMSITTILDGLTIASGHADGDRSENHNRDAGLYGDDAHLAMINCVIHSPKAEYDGRAAYLYAGTLTPSLPRRCGR